MKLTLKAPGSKRLKLKYDELLSNVAFNFNLRRCITGRNDVNIHAANTKGRTARDVSESAAITREITQAMVRRCRLTVSKPALKAPMVSALEAAI